MSNEKKLQTAETDLDAQARSTGAVLAKEKKVRIKIPEDHKNPVNRVVPVCINGYLYYINRGQTVEVPETVADILAQAQYI
jgi:hypothetical protein